MNVLVVDDNADIRLLASTVLSMQGYDVSEAVDGESALVAVRADDPPDVVLLDIRLPAPGGLEVLDAIRAEALPVRVVMFSADAEDATEAEAMARGADGYLVKPFSADVLTATIERVLASTG